MNCLILSGFLFLSFLSGYIGYVRAKEIKQDHPFILGIFIGLIFLTILGILSLVSLKDFLEPLIIETKSSELGIFILLFLVSIYLILITITEDFLKNLSIIINFIGNLWIKK